MAKLIYGVKQMSDQQNTGDDDGHRQPNQEAYGNSSRASNFSFTRTPNAFTTTPTSERTIPDSGIRAGEIVGYRAWRLYAITEFTGHLWSLVRYYEWPIHDIPEATSMNYWCGGFYAFKTMQQVEEFSVWGTYYPIVIGSVSMWGTVYEHDLGYRSQYAYPRSFDRLIGKQSLISKLIHGEHLKQLRKRYLTKE